jgi:hypothetical protein
MAALARRPQPHGHAGLVRLAHDPLHGRVELPPHGEAELPDVTGREGKARLDGGDGHGRRGRRPGRGTACGGRDDHSRRHGVHGPRRNSTHTRHGLDSKRAAGPRKIRNAGIRAPLPHRLSAPAYPLLSR